MIPYDYHMHSAFSCDCQAPMPDMVAQAARLGLPEIGFTEHYDRHPKDECRDFFQLEAWLAELRRNRDEFAGQLTIRAGLEVGEPHRFGREMEALLARHEFDYVIGSVHYVGDITVFEKGYFDGRPPRAVYGDYFAEVHKMALHGGFDILAHLDVAKRYGFEYLGPYYAADYEDFIRPILRALIDNQIALEINTSALRRKVNQLSPTVEVLKWYRELGGERLTIGSDAHRPDQLGAGLDLALEAARAAGFKRLTQFAKRQSRWVSI